MEHDLTQAAQLTNHQMHQDPSAASQLIGTTSLLDAVVDVEKNLLAEIIRHLERNRMSTEQAQTLAKAFLSLLPFVDQKDFLKKLYKLKMTNSEATGVHLEYAKQYDETDTQTKDVMRKLIQQGNIDQAIAVAKGEKMSELMSPDSAPARESPRLKPEALSNTTQEKNGLKAAKKIEESIVRKGTHEELKEIADGSLTKPFSPDKSPNDLKPHSTSQEKKGGRK